MGHRPVCAVEIEPYCRKVLLARQQDGILPKFPIWDDVTTFNGKPWRDRVDIVCGGFPCQDISCAGSGKGITGKRSGLWVEMQRIVCEIGPRLVFVENSPMLTIRGLGRVLGGLAEMGYNAKWGVFSGRFVGARQNRDRLFLLACSDQIRCSSVKFQNTVISPRPLYSELLGIFRTTRKVNNPKDTLTPYEVATWLEQFKSTGNGQIPAVAAIAFLQLSRGLI